MPSTTTTTIWEDNGGRTISYSSDGAAFQRLNPGVAGKTMAPSQNHGPPNSDSDYDSLGHRRLRGCFCEGVVNKFPLITAHEVRLLLSTFPGYWDLPPWSKVV